MLRRFFVVLWLAWAGFFVLMAAAAIVSPQSRAMFADLIFGLGITFVGSLLILWALTYITGAFRK